MEKLKSLIKEAIKEQGQYSSAGSVDISTSHLNGKIQVRPASTMGKLVSAFGCVSGISLYSVADKWKTGERGHGKCVA